MPCLVYEKPTHTELRGAGTCLLYEAAVVALKGGASGCHENIHGGVVGGAGRLFSCERMEKLFFECVG